LLDYDDRLSQFYSVSEFARYSLLTNYFYHSQSKQHLIDFFQCSKRIIVICDPPFGVYLTALMRTIQSLKQMYFFERETKSSDNFKVVLFLPFFIGKHLQKEFIDFSMVDYKVTYSNHKDYCKSDKTIVRIFTDLPNTSFCLDSIAGYRFCDQCNKYVAEKNAHCFKCNACTSKDGLPYKHCNLCKRCVKSKYHHCSKCKNCHLKNRCFTV